MNWGNPIIKKEKSKGGGGANLNEFRMAGERVQRWKATLNKWKKCCEKRESGKNYSNQNSKIEYQRRVNILKNKFSIRPNQKVVVKY